MHAFLFANAFSDIARSFGVDWPHFIAQCISFLLVAFFLHRFAYRPVLQILEARKQRIAESLENTERIQRELAETKTARKVVLDQAHQEANRLIAEAKAIAAQVQEEETQKAIATAERIQAKAHEAVERDHARMLAELKREIARLVVDITGNVSGKVLSADDQRRLVEETNESLAV